MDILKLLPFEESDGSAGRELALHKPTQVQFPPRVSPGSRAKRKPPAPLSVVPKQNKTKIIKLVKLVLF